MDNPIYRAIDILTLQRCAEEADAVTDLLAEIERLRAALHDVLQCTPFVCFKADGPAVHFDCGNPFEIARAALKENDEPRDG